MTDGSCWTELRYTGTQALPEDDGVRDELDGIAMWAVDVAVCYHDRPEQVVAHGAVAVFDLESHLDLARAARAYGGAVRRAGELLLTRDGRLQDDLVFDGVDLAGIDKVVLFLQVVIGRQGRGLGMPAANAVRERLGSRRSLVACYPEPRATNATEPEFFLDVPVERQQAWWRRGLTYRGGNLWLLPPSAAATTAAARAREPVHGRA